MKQIKQNPQGYRAAIVQAVQNEGGRPGATLLVSLAMWAALTEAEAGDDAALERWSAFEAAARRIGRTQDAAMSLLRQALALAVPLARPQEALSPLARARRLAFDANLTAVIEVAERVKEQVQVALSIEMAPR